MEASEERRPVRPVGQTGLTGHENSELVKANVVLDFFSFWTSVTYIVSFVNYTILCKFELNL